MLTANSFDRNNGEQEMYFSKIDMNHILSQIMMKRRIYCLIPFLTKTPSGLKSTGKPGNWHLGIFW